MASLSQRLKDRAKELGLSPVGITTATPLYEARRILEQAEALPFTTGSVLQRTDPKLVWPEAKSVMMVGLPYIVPAEGPQAGTLQGYFAAGSGGQDYHCVLKEKLAELAAFLQSEAPGALTVPFVDTGPLVERALAYRAGLGVWGENNFVLRPQVASAFFLGGLATNVDLISDSSIAGTCLQCGQCRDACPTNALDTPYLLDYRRCLSYWTQAKEVMPPELRPLLGNRLYGCDTCLRACPLIEKSPLDGVTVDLATFLAIGNREFKQRYASSSFAWRGRTVLQRNAVLALGNSGREEAIPILIPLLSDPRISIRITAAWSLGQYGAFESRLALAKCLQQEIEPSVQAEIKKALNESPRKW